MRARKTIEAQIPMRTDRLYRKNYNSEDMLYLVVELLLDIRELLQKIPSNKANSADAKGRS